VLAVVLAGVAVRTVHARLPVRIVIAQLLLRALLDFRAVDFRRERLRRRCSSAKFWRELVCPLFERLETASEEDEVGGEGEGLDVDLRLGRFVWPLADFRLAPLAACETWQLLMTIGQRNSQAPSKREALPCGRTEKRSVQYGRRIVSDLSGGALGGRADLDLAALQEPEEPGQPVVTRRIVRRGGGNGRAPCTPYS
jgi:hypothetical protein